MYGFRGLIETPESLKKAQQHYLYMKGSFLHKTTSEKVTAESFMTTRKPSQK
jgi:hypothetical protein